MVSGGLVGILRGRSPGSSDGPVHREVWRRRTAPPRRPASARLAAGAAAGIDPAPVPIPDR